VSAIGNNATGGQSYPAGPGWHAYSKIVCDRQTCMAHIFSQDPRIH
jgi:hypothetical protein